MAFSAANKDAIAAYLGYSITSDNQTIIDNACSAVTALSSDAETRVISYLAQIAAIDAEIETARVTVGSAVGQLQSQGRRYIGMVAIALSLDIRSDYYSQ